VADRPVVNDAEEEPTTMRVSWRLFDWRELWPANGVDRSRLWVRPSAMPASMPETAGCANDRRSQVKRLQQPRKPLPQGRSASCLIDLSVLHTNFNNGLPTRQECLGHFRIEVRAACRVFHRTCCRSRGREVTFHKNLLAGSNPTAYGAACHRPTIAVMQWR
jgi:hypothetical protein